MDIDREKFDYIKAVLIEVRAIAQKQRADLLTYIIEMAVQETDDIITGRRPLDPATG